MTLLEELEQALSARYPDTRALPVAAYAASEVFELERANVVNHAWIPMCAAGALPDAGGTACVCWSRTGRRVSTALP